ncbi:sensor histidine kinase [Pelagimonas varians]|uniref:histidine kinase n=1 Tax=Pelagimonas varians TaxID=696760 RepID=A0A238KT42_9RHOB|nr:ATP-binding protein [Pelagimonas varians]PYG32534.1 two-component system C4-dicarboxylate transport sensor histidine kinase DctB [Pelagimonas varians]SMX45840.1 C4-dicarboxylate transport sensor protein DctB [Pelagimonas varians]
MAAEANIDHIAGKMRKSILGVLLVTVLLATAATFFGAQRYFERLELQTASVRLVLYLRSLNEALLQHQHLPFILAQDPRYSDELDPSSVDPKTNGRLRSLAEQANLEAIYLMDSSGLVLAASNSDELHTFLGQNYGFRPYFQDALQGQRSDYFAIGATSGRPGYFVAEPVIFANGTHKGVAAIKLDVSKLQRSWESSKETVIAINKDGIVVLASNPKWLYRPINQLGPDERNAILESRQFGALTLEPLDWSEIDPNRVTLDGNDFLIASGTADWREWTVLYLQPEKAILRKTLLATAIFGSIITCLVGFATFLRSRRIEVALAASELRSGELTEANERLELAQAELARSGKLAALGHLAASVTHELGQPISAFRNHLTAAEIGNEISSPKTLANLNNLVNRMESITGQFRYFARARADEKTDVKLLTILEEAEGLLKTEIQTAGITVTRGNPFPQIEVNARQVQLEQAFTNLFKNAIHAVANVAAPQIAINVTQDEKNVMISVADNGPGLASATLADLQEPFFSTKPSGVGMGLGLAITTEIIKDHGGTLALGNPEIGAEFVVTLPLSRSGDAA